MQWTPGAGPARRRHAPGGSRYDQVIAATVLWIMFSGKEGRYDDWVEAADRIVKRYGPEKLYFLFPEMPEKEAEALMAKAERDWVR